MGFEIRWYAPDGTPLADASEYQKYMGEKIVAQTDIPDKELWVSTVWLGLDHRYGDGPPLIYETMVFRLEDGKQPTFEDIYSERYSDRKEAADGHARVVAMIEQGETGEENGFYGMPSNGAD